MCQWSVSRPDTNLAASILLIDLLLSLSYKSGSGFSMDNLKQFETFLFLTRGLSSDTVNRTIRLLNTLERECDVFDKESLQNFLIGKLNKLSAAGYNQYVKVLRRYYDFKKFNDKDFEFLKYLNEKPKQRILLRDEEIEKLINLDPPPSRFGVFWTLLAYCGARPGEIRQLKQEDFDLNSGVVYFHTTKTQSRKAPLLPFLIDGIQKYLNSLNTDLLFPSIENNGRPFTEPIYMKDWHRRIKKIGANPYAKPYGLRHSFLTNSLGNGANLFAIQDIVGHVSANTTRMYYHGNLDLMKKAAQQLPLAQKQSNPEELAEFLNKLIDDHLMKDPRFDKSKLMDAKKNIYESIKTSENPKT